MRNRTVVVDLQFGSTGKGLIAGYLADTTHPDTVMTAWAANAGHTYIDSNGTKFVHTMLANGIVSRALRRVMMGPGSLIDPINLQNEIDAARALGYINPSIVDIMIHPNAAIITQEHRDLEAGPMTKIGSTKKGVGEAAIQRIRRDPDRQNVASVMLKGTPLAPLVCTRREWDNAVDASENVLIEGAQGVSLSLYHGFYPYVTSRDVSTYQILADVGMPFGSMFQTNIVGTLRTYPIRVAHRYAEDGSKVGDSGPMFDDQKEVSWEYLGVEPEFTTVTKLKRRVFTFSMEQIKQSVRLTGADRLFLNFCNYLLDSRHVVRFTRELERGLEPLGLGTYVRWFGVGPGHNDVIDRPDILKRFKTSIRGAQQ